MKFLVFTQGCSNAANNEENPEIPPKKRRIFDPALVASEICVRSTLEKSVWGNLILENYAITKGLTETDRTDLVDIIYKELIEITQK